MSATASLRTPTPSLLTPSTNAPVSPIRPSVYWTVLYCTYTSACAGSYRFPFAAQTWLAASSHDYTAVSQKPQGVQERPTRVCVPPDRGPQRCLRQLRDSDVYPAPAHVAPRRLMLGQLSPSLRTLTQAQRPGIFTRWYRYLRDRGCMREAAALARAVLAFPKGNTFW